MDDVNNIKRNDQYTLALACSLLSQGNNGGEGDQYRGARDVGGV